MFLATVKQGDEEIVILDNYEDDLITMKAVLNETMAGYDDRDYLYLPELKKNNLNDYLMFLELQELSFSTILARGEETKLHLLDPRYWQILKKYNVNEVEFLNFSYYDIRKVDYTVEGYKDVVNLKYDAFLREIKRNRYVDVLITSVREMEGGSMKIKYYGGEDKLAYKEEGYSQIISLLKSKLNEKETFAQEVDEKLKKK
jgi:hypothetical protein